jgi:hypothetical protein
MGVDVGTLCPGCLTQGRPMMLFEIAPGRKVCGDCFDKVKAAEKTEPHPKDC